MTMTPKQFSDALKTVDWTARHVATIAGYNPSLGAQWVSGRCGIPPKLGTWLQELADAHKRAGGCPTNRNENDPIDKKGPDQWQRIAARVAVKKALKAGTLGRQLCAVCGELKVEAHHPDYAKQLEVVWLCSKHHKMLHDQQRVGPMAILRAERLAHQLQQREIHQEKKRYREALASQ